MELTCQWSFHKPTKMSKKRLSLEQLRAVLESKKKKKSSAVPDTTDEHYIQCECVRYFNLRYPYLRGRLFAVPNGGRRDVVTGARLKAEGVVAGVSDLILLKKNRYYGALLIEMKKRTGKQSESQKQWEQLVCADGEFKYVKCHSFDDFKREVDDFLSDRNK